MAYVLSNTGKAMETSIMAGNPISYYITSGSNPSGLTSEETDIALFSEVGPRVLATPSTITTNTTDDTLQVTGAIQPTTAVTIAEAGLADIYTVPVVGVLQSSSTVIGSLNGTQVVSNVALTPGNNGYIQIRGEIMKVTAGSGTTTLTVLRGQAGTSAINTIVSNDPIAQGNPPGVTTVTGGNMFAKADFNPVELVEGDSLVFTWEFVYQ